MKWSVVSNTAERSKERRTEMTLLSFANRKSLKHFMKAVSTECWNPKLDVVGLEVSLTRGSIINSEYISSLNTD